MKRDNDKLATVVGGPTITSKRNVLNLFEDGVYLGSHLLAEIRQHS